MKIAMVAYGDISHDSRIQREANSLAEAGYDVAVFALAGSRGTRSRPSTREWRS